MLSGQKSMLDHALELRRQQDLSGMGAVRQRGAARTGHTCCRCRTRSRRERHAVASAEDRGDFRATDREPGKDSHDQTQHPPHDNLPLPRVCRARPVSYPFLYSDDEWTDLGALAELQHDDPGGRLGAWARSFVAGPPTDTLSLLKDLNAGVTMFVAYEIREDEGTQSPVETLDRAGRIVPRLRDAARRGGAQPRLRRARRLRLSPRSRPRSRGFAGHGLDPCVAEVYVPAAGWITFDPTNLSVGGANLIPVAVARDIRQAIPVSGGFVGPDHALDDMSVEVTVAAAEDAG